MATKRKLKQLPPMTPGEMLSEHFIAGYEGMTPYDVAIRIGKRPSVVYELINNKRSITAALALRLGEFFGNSAEFWLNLQAYHDLHLARAKEGDAVKREVKPAALKYGNEVAA